MDDPVFIALADPTRRHLLDLLFERDGRTLGELVAAVHGMTRFGVMKHLRVLETADLVTARRVGREKHHYLNPVPIRQLHDRWLDKYRTRAADSLLDLKHVLENMEGNPMTSTTAPAFVSSVYIRATPEAIWRAITETDYTLRYYYGSAIETDWKPGSPYRMTIAGELQIEGEVVEVDPPRRLVQTFHAVWDEGVKADPPTRVTWEIEAAMPGVSKVVVLHDGLLAGSSTLEQVSGGWPL
ncbi:MAG: ArsR/SmtB family transcription factor, partial [Acidimicrobiales bacterium]